VFGNPETARVATLGINPSSREFVDINGRELQGRSRRFHTLASLGLRRWADAEERHLRLVKQCCVNYFRGNPYDAWFRKLDYIIAGASATYYGVLSSACHLDLVPYATSPKWAMLAQWQRAFLLRQSVRAIAEILRESKIDILILNGRSVVEEFQRIAGVQLNTSAMSEWTLPRRSVTGVRGLASSGSIEKVGSLKFGRRITVLGFNHNIQSSFGVTRQVLDSIRHWVLRTTRSPEKPLRASKADRASPRAS
jgi:hypothetical protein